ncbi:MAG TPA: hypothetical protein P5114_06760 [Hyphomicrobiaceae bacterium]|nr:hypothetical protein [Hyphomicrobiaceae bacterium]
MKFSLIVVASAALMAVSTAAGAFQEQQGSAAGAAGQVAPQTSPAKPEMQFSTPDGLKDEAKGPEVRIPGLGKLGVLPKMDFGLELLYGAASESKAESTRPDTMSEDSDLRIRGTVKHRF